MNNGEQEQYAEPGKNGKRKNRGKIVKRTILVAGLVLAVYMVYSIVYLFVSPDRNIQQIYLVPEDAAFIIQSSAPIEDWGKFSGSETWQCLKKAKSFEEVTKSVENWIRLSEAIRCCCRLLANGTCLFHFIRFVLRTGIFCWFWICKRLPKWIY